MLSILETPWKIDPVALRALDEYEDAHPDTPFHWWLERFNEGAEGLKSIVDLIPNEPVPAKALIGLLFNICKLAQDGHEAGKSLVELAQNIVAFMSDVRNVWSKGEGLDGDFSTNMWTTADGIKNVMDKIVAWVCKQLNKSSFRRSLSSRKINQKVSELKLEFDAALQRFNTLCLMNATRERDAILSVARSHEIALHSQMTALRAQEAVLHSQEDSAILHARLPMQATLGRHHPCHPDTRITILKRIKGWVAEISHSSQRVFWLSGNPGAGKSTIATTICNDLRPDLVCRFFFNLSTDPTALFKSLAAQLSLVNQPASEVICKALRADAFICDALDNNQVDKLFVEPLKVASLMSHNSPFLIVIDALDEISPPHQSDIPNQIIRAAKELPTNVKIFVTSRPEGYLTATFENRDSLVQRYHVVTDGVEAYKDIKAYLKSEMSYVVKSFNMTHKEEKDQLDPNWPGEKRIGSLCNQASGLFIWAATAVLFIRNQLDRRGKQRIQAIFDLLDKDGMADINNLYQKVLQQAYDDDGWHISDFAVFRQIVGALVTLEEPLELRELEQLLSLADDFDLLNFFRRLQSVLVLDTNEVPSGDTIPRMHLSFIEFITSSLRCKDNRFQVRLDMAHLQLAQSCLTTLQTLRYNICNIPSFGTKFDRDVIDLHSRLEYCVPKSVRYASRFWGTHLAGSAGAARTLAGSPKTHQHSRSSQETDIWPDLQSFLENHLLHWMEAMSLLDKVHSIANQLQAVIGWLMDKDSQENTHLSNLLSDALHLVQFAEPVSVNAAHFYSALQFAPRASALYKRYQPMFGHPIEVLAGAPDLWTGFLRVLSSNSSSVFSFATSFCASLTNNEVKVWDMISGRLIGIAKHNDHIAHIWLSSDGKFLVTHILMGRLEIRDSMHCEHVRFQVLGATARFSPHGRYIIARCGQKLQLWDVSSGSPIHDPLEMTKFISDVAVCDAQTLAVAFLDGSISTFDGRTGALIYGLSPTPKLTRHITFSLGGDYVSSASFRALRIWNAAMGDPIGSEKQIPFCALSTHFSIDGKHIVAYGNSEIWICDVQTGTIGPECIYNDGTISIPLTMNAGWLQCESDGRLVCWIPQERRGNWELVGGKVIMRSPLFGDVETVIDIREFFDGEQSKRS